MELELTDEAAVAVVLEDGENKVAFHFRNSNHQDLVYAASAIKQSDLTGEQPAIDRDAVIKYVFRALKTIEGDLVSAGEPVSVDKLRELAEKGKITGIFASKIIIPWATRILEIHGFFKEALRKQISKSA